METGAAAGFFPKRSLVTSDHLRHVESMARLPSGAGKISHLNAIILGESLASEENDLVFPSPEFSAQALVSSPEQVRQLAPIPDLHPPLVPFSSSFLLFISVRCELLDLFLAWFNRPRWMPLLSLKVWKKKSLFLIIEVIVH